MRNKIINSMLAGVIALVVSSCTTSQMAVQNASSDDDVYNSNVEARKITYAARTTNNYSETEENVNNRQSYNDEGYESRLDIDNRNPITWQDNYYNNHLSYDPFFHNNWFTPGFSVGLGWNNWGFNHWNIGFNNWGWNNWGWNSWGWNMGYNPWYSPYHSPFWGPYSYYGGFGRPFYGGYYGGGYWGGGLWGGGYVNRNPGVARPDRGSGRVSSARPSSQNNVGRSSVSRIPRPSDNTRPSVGGRPSDRNSVGTSRPSRTETSQTRHTTQTRPTTQQRPTRSEGSGNSRPSVDRGSSQPSYTPARPSSGGGSSSGGGGGRSSSGGSSRPSR